jgi:hypothetical protein
MSIAKTFPDRRRGILIPYGCPAYVLSRSENRAARVACVLISHFPVAVELVDGSDRYRHALVIAGAPLRRKAVLDCSAEASSR